VIEPGELVERIWERDPTVWTGTDEAQWLGWLDEPLRMRQRLDELAAVAEAAAGADDVVLLGMGGSSLAPEVLRRAFRRDRFHVLDTTHPKAIRRLADSLDLDRTLFVVSSKSGGTLETRSQFDFFWERGGRRAVVITDPGSPLEQLAQTRGVQVVAGEPTIGGRYSALSPFGLVPAALMGVDVGRLLDRAEETLNACRVADDNPGLALGLALGAAWQEGRDKVVIRPNPHGFGLWVEQLLAESTGKNGRGLVPAPDESPDGADRQVREVELDDPYDLGSEFYRWEFATAVAGAILEIDPFDQPNVQRAKDKTNEVLAAGAVRPPEPEGSVEELLAQAKPGDYVAVQAFVDPAEEEALQPFVKRARARTDCVVTFGLGPRYLHSTGQLHKGGAPIGCFLQVVDETGDELAIPGKRFGFGSLINAQAEGDYELLKERGRPVARIRLEEAT
jgi:transaldolase / glucose-6-phosphate isomerase